MEKLKKFDVSKVKQDINDKIVLNIGSSNNPELKLHKMFLEKNWKSVTVDSDKFNPDIVTNIHDINDKIDDDSVEAIWGINLLNRCHSSKLKSALASYYRVLKMGCNLITIVPDLEFIGEMIAKKGLEKEVFKQGDEVFRVFDLIYGNSRLSANSETFLSGFTAKSLSALLKNTDFGNIQIKRDGYALLLVAQKLPPNENKKVKIIQQDVNEMMGIRDELDVPPVYFEIE